MDDEFDQELFYFVIIYTNYDDKERVKVIDLQTNMHYERNDWQTADHEDYDNPIDAIAAARKYAALADIKYEPFTSRYGGPSEHSMDIPTESKSHWAYCPHCGESL